MAGSENRSRPRLIHEELTEVERTDARLLPRHGNKDRQIRVLAAEIGRPHHKLENTHRADA